MLLMLFFHSQCIKQDEMSPLLFLFFFCVCVFFFFVAHVHHSAFFSFFLFFFFLAAAGHKRVYVSVCVCARSGKPSLCMLSLSLFFFFFITMTLLMSLLTFGCFRANKDFLSRRNSVRLFSFFLHADKVTFFFSLRIVCLFISTRTFGRRSVFYRNSIDASGSPASFTYGTFSLPCFLPPPPPPPPSPPLFLPPLFLIFHK